MTDDVRTRIEQAIRELPGKKDRQRIKLAVAALTGIARPPSVPIGNPLSFNNVGEPRVKRQLTSLTKLADADLARLAKLTADLRAPVITLLADHGWLRQDRNPARAREAAMAALRHVQSGRWEAPKADRGRPAKPRDDCITAIAAWHYKALTGKEPRRSRFGFFSADAGKPTGPFYRFLKEIFKAAGIATNPAAGIDRHRKRKWPSPPDWRQCSWRQIDGDWCFLPDGCDQERSIARVSRSGRFWYATLTRPTHRAGWAPFAIVNNAAVEAAAAARDWVEEQFAEDEQHRLESSRGVPRGSPFSHHLAYVHVPRRFP